MESKQSLRLKSLARKLKKLLKRYESVYDFIIFGSIVKDKMSPADIDVAVITSSKDAMLTGKIKNSLDGNVHLQVVSYGDFLKTKVPYYILSEGFSVKENKFISKIAGIERDVLYWFNLISLSQSQKAMFNRALRALITSTESEHIGKGAVLVPVNHSGEFEDFLNQWNIKIKKKDFIAV